MHNFLKVEGHPGLVRDTSSGAIVSNDQSAFKEYMDAVNLSRKKEESQKHRDQELNTVKKELEELKALVAKLLQEKK